MKRNLLTKWILESCQKYGDRKWMNQHTYHHLSQTLMGHRHIPHHITSIGRIRIFDQPLLQNSSRFMYSLFQTWYDNKIACILPFSGSKKTREYCCHLINQHANGLHEQEDDALILFTSGTTTGEPKGVRLSHFNIASQLEMLRQHVPSTLLGEKDRTCGILPWSHCYGLIGECLSMFDRGGHVVPWIPKSPKSVSLSFHIVTTQPTVLFVVPYLLNKWKEMDMKTRQKIPRQLLFGSHLRYIVSGGAPLSFETRDYFWKRWNIPIYEGYGCTEMSPMIGLQTCFYTTNTTFPLLPNVQIDIVRETNELRVRGPNRFIGYLGKPTFHQDDWFSTGDIIDPKNTSSTKIVLTKDRASDVLKLSNGRFISLTTIETFLEKKYNSTYTCVRWNYEKEYFEAIVSVPTIRHSQTIPTIISLSEFGTIYPIRVSFLSIDKFSIDLGTLTLKGQCNRSVLFHRFYS